MSRTVYGTGQIKNILAVPDVTAGGYHSGLFSKLLDDRIVTVFGEINDEMAEVVVSELLYLASRSDDDIQLYINSPGGSVSAGWAIYDVMQRIRPDVATIATGVCASMASVLLSGGKPGKRYAEKHAMLMIHQVSGQASGQETDIRIAAEHTRLVREELNKALSENCRQSISKIEADTERDLWLNPSQALEYGLIDKIL